MKYLELQFRKAGVKVALGAEVTHNLVQKIKPDATGATPTEPRIMDVDRPNVVHAWC